jgi:subtilisin family serine protease
VPRAYLLRLPEDRDVRAAARAYERNPNVQYAEPNHVGQLFATPNDSIFTQGYMWALHNTGQQVPPLPNPGTTGTADADIDAPEAWDTTTGSSAVVVGVADTGIAYDHPDLAPNIWSNPGETVNGLDDDGNGKIDDFRGWDFVQNDNDPMDFDSHGTHVAGTIGAVGNNGLGLPGVNWNVRLAPLRMCSPNPTVGCSAAAAADAFAYAGQKGMQVVNGSFGTSFAQVVADAITNAPNTLFVFAAGNGGGDGIGDDNDSAAIYPCQHTAPNILCVAASDQNDNRASFSNYGDTAVDLAAPGTNIVSAWPNSVRFEEHFTGSFGAKWTTGGTNNTWGQLCDPAFGGLGCVMTDSPPVGAAYQNNTSSFSRTSPAFDTTGFADCRAQFLMNYGLADIGDQVFVESSTDAVNWSTVSSAQGPAVSGWVWVDAPLGVGLNNQPAAYLRWRLSTNGAAVHDGVYVDEIFVRCRRTDYSAGTEYALKQGTSMASPHVAGAAALAFAKEPFADVAGVKNAILDGVDPKTSLKGPNGVASGGRLNLNGMLTKLACCHVRPAGASPLIVSLVPEYVQCGINPVNRTHGPPLAHPSCAPPVKRSPYLTVGTPDANGAAANSVGQARLATLVGDPGTPADEADVKFEFSMTDVRRQTAGFPDYTGDLDANFAFRLTDRTVGAEATATTLVDTSINPFFVVSCAATASTLIGSTCSGTTTAEAIVPGLLKEGARAIWQLDEIDIGDGGPDGDVFTAPNQIFATQGIFVP